MEQFKAENSAEKARKKFIYIDHSEVTPQVVFECEAFDIAEADELYGEETGRDVSKEPYIGCAIEDEDGAHLHAA
jgi:hypothetical protein